jgi:Kef-type K+ transport system membrane component KefB/CBS domain-containing protein
MAALCRPSLIPGETIFMDLAQLTAILGTLGMIWLAGLAGGRLAGLWRVPRVTGYLLVGLLIGPSFAHLTGIPELIRPAILTDLKIVSEVALGLILLNIGGQFRVEHLRRWRHRILLFSCGEITLMVIQEYGAEGPVTHSALTLVGLNNIFAIFSFIIATHLLTAPGGDLHAILFQILGPILIGGLIGFLLSIWAQRLESVNELKILLLGGALLVGGACRWLGCNALLGSLIFGMALANSSPRWHHLMEALQQIAYPLYVVFFVIAGANMHLETLGQLGLFGIGYVVARTIGKLAGSRLGAFFGRFDSRLRQYTGLTLLGHGGIAIGLSGSLASLWPAGGRLVETIVLGSVVFFEMVGPLAIRFGLVRAGEVPILSLLQKRSPQGTMEGLHSVVHHFRSSLGLPAGHKVRDPGDILVKHIMRRNVETILNSTAFNDLLHLIAHSRYDRFPVVDGEGRFIGMINYTEIRNLLFEPTLANLVIASDLTGGPRAAVSPDQTLREALDVLNRHRHISYFPVVDPEQPDRLIGILSQNDLIAAFRRQETS